MGFTSACSVLFYGNFDISGICFKLATSARGGFREVDFARIAFSASIINLSSLLFKQQKLT